MEVNFNELRKSLIRKYNTLVKKARDVDQMPEEGYDHIIEALQELRNDVVIIACLYDEKSGIVSLANEKILVP